MLASLLEAGAWLNLSGEGSRDGRSPEHWAAPSELTGSHGKRPRTVKQLCKACQDTAARGGAWGSPHRCAGPSHNALPAQHLVGTATSAAREMLVPRQGLKAVNACADQKTKQREQWVCSGYSQRGMGRV